MSIGTIAERTGFDSYGNLSTPISTGNPFAFTGVLHEPTTALYLMPLRACDPTLGRFLSEDPLPAVSLYVYALNSPTVLMDPTGAQALKEYGMLINLSMSAVTGVAQAINPCSLGAGSIGGGIAGSFAAAELGSALLPTAIGRASAVMLGTAAGIVGVVVQVHWTIAITIVAGGC